MSVRIEKALPDDAAELLNIYGPYVTDTSVSFEHVIPSVEEFEHRIRNISSKYPYIKAVDEAGNILGYAYAGAFKGRRAYDWAVETTIYIRKDKRRSGVGRSLYEALEKSLLDMGILNLNECIAYAEVEDEYLTNDSMRFHEKLGYNLVGTFHKCGYKFNKWYDMIWMEKIIGEHTDNQPEVEFGKWNVI